MKLGINTFIWSAEFTESQVPLLPKIKAAGFDGIEVAIFDPRSFPAAMIRKAAENEGLGCTVVAVIPKGMSLVAEDSSVRGQTLGHVQGVIEKTAELGAEILSGPLHSPVGYLPGRRRTPAEWENAIESYHSLAPLLDAHKVTLAIEPLNRFETFFLNTAADSAELCRRVNHPRVGILFDTFHANIEEKDIAAGYETVGPWLKHVHTCENDRGTPGSGHVPWKAVFAALKKVNYDGWLTIESFGFNLKEIAAAAAIWRDIEATPDAIAFDGIRFLKTQL